MSIITYLDENEFRKRVKALRIYFPKCYKYLEFQAFPILRKENKIDGIYEVELPSGDLFKRVYGPMLLKFSVQNDVAILEDITPSEFLLTCFNKYLPIYKGIPYDSKKDLFKIKLEVAKDGLEI